MRVLVHPHHMEMGGSQYNAIELADAVRAHGHEVVVYAPPGILNDEVKRRDLELVLAPAVRRMAPSPVSAARLTRLAKDFGADVVHTYEWNATLDGLHGPGLLLGTPVLSTVLSMWIPDFFPPSMPMVVGTRDLLLSESERRADVTLIEPPVDVAANQPGAAPFFSDRGDTVRDRWGIAGDAFLLVLVGRLAADLKITGVLEAVRAVGLLPEAANVHLLIVGDGPERARVEAAAAEVNQAGRERRVTLAGTVMDPRPVYDAADLVLGMGGSILRGLAFGKPAIVQGEGGFWLPVDSSTMPTFLQQGWFGCGPGDDGAPRLAHHIEQAQGAGEGLAERGALGRQLVMERYSLDVAAAGLSDVYHRLRAAPHAPMPERARAVGAASLKRARSASVRAGRAAFASAGRRTLRPLGSPDSTNAPVEAGVS